LNILAITALLTSHEAKRPFKYKDTKGKVTVGIGCNMDAKGCREMFAAVLPHVNFDAVYGGKVGLSETDIQTLFQHQLGVAEADAKKLVPSFDIQPENVQLALTDMSFEMGYTKLSFFTKFLAAVSREDYPAAIAQITNSVYFHEVPSRARDNVALLTTAANYRTFQPEVPPSAAP
jgi:lysozyme